MLLKFFKQGEAGDTGPCEDDIILPSCIPAQAPGHHAMELGLVLQSIQAIWATTFLQVDIDLERKCTEVRQSKATWAIAEAAGHIGAENTRKLPQCLISLVQS